LRLKDLLGPVTRVKKKKKKTARVIVSLSQERFHGPDDRIHVHETLLVRDKVESDTLKPRVE